MLVQYIDTLVALGVVPVRKCVGGIKFSVLGLRYLDRFLTAPPRTVCVSNFLLLSPISVGCWTTIRIVLTINRIGLSARSDS